MFTQATNSKSIHCRYQAIGRDIHGRSKLEEQLKQSPNPQIIFAILIMSVDNNTKLTQGEQKPGIEPNQGLETELMRPGNYECIEYFIYNTGTGTHKMA